MSTNVPITNVILPHFLLPRLPMRLYTYIDPQDSPHLPTPVMNESLSFYLNDIKHHIHTHEYLWETFKKFTNVYEYIHSTIPYKKYCISRYRPLSRSFFKMIELIHFFELGTDSQTPMRTFHLAEGPGGFIEAMVKYRNCPEDRYTGMTLMDKNNNDYNIPAWKKSQHFLQENKNVHIESGYDKTGNILSLDNFVYINEVYGSSMDLITADGGFDFSTDFDHQEINMTKLLYGQILYALCMQKQGGCFVLKIFDVFMQHTIDMIALLASMYEKVYITKPNTSRSANSEKYVVCKGFLHASSYKFFPTLQQSFRKVLACNDGTMVIAPKSGKSGARSGSHFAEEHTIMPTPSKHRYITRIFNHLPINYFFLNRLEECNIVLGQNQIENIYVTLSFIVGECMPQCRANWVALPPPPGLVRGQLGQRMDVVSGAERRISTHIPKIAIGDQRNMEVASNQARESLVRDRKQTHKRTGIDGPLIDVVDPNSVPIETDLRETLKGIEAVEFPASAKGSIADTPNQRNFYRTKIHNLIKTNIQKCIQWCIQHNLAYNY
jgi:FtsJ-like methyltransferase